MDYLNSWDAFCARVFADCGRSGKYLQILYGAGGMALMLTLVSMLGFAPFAFVTFLLGFLITPPGMLIGAALGATAVSVMRFLFSERRTLEPVLKRLTEAKVVYEHIINAHPDPLSIGRRRLIDSLLGWVLSGGPQPSFL